MDDGDEEEEAEKLLIECCRHFVIVLSSYWNIGGIMNEISKTPDKLQMIVYFTAKRLPPPTTE